MLTLRPLRWPDDRPSLLALDTSFDIDRVYQVVQRERSFTRTAVSITPPLHKDYAFADDIDSLTASDCVILAKIDTTLVGIVAFAFEAWNRRALVEHLYIAPEHRGHGVGRAFIDAAVTEAQKHNVRCLWLETQNINYAAILFYEQVGFQ